jgi:hypothetical protein
VSLDTGRHAAVAIGKVQRQLAARLVPVQLAVAATRCLVGCIHTPFALLYDPCMEALAAVLDAYPTDSWPVVLEALQAAQAQALAGGQDTVNDEEEEEEEEEETGREARSRRGHGSNRVDGEEEEEAEAEAAEEEEEDEDDPDRLPTATQRLARLSRVDERCTDVPTRLGLLLRALAKAKGGGGGSIDQRVTALVPMFLTYATLEAGEEEEEDVEDESMYAEQAKLERSTRGSSANKAAATTPVVGDCEGRRVRAGGRQWRIGLRAWLAVVARLTTLKGHNAASTVRRVLETLLGDVDPGVQRLALAALKLWRLPFLTPYLSNLERLVDPSKP